MKKIEKPQLLTEHQINIDFETIRWPDHELFPLNQKKNYRTVESIIYRDIKDSTNYIIVTGFTSLSNLIDFFGSQDFEKLDRVRILIGFEPNIIGRKKYLKSNLEKEIKDYWLKKGLSIMLGGAVINLITKITTKKIEFRFKDKLHAKLYVGNNHAILGSSNFSKNGLNAQQEANIRIINSVENSVEKQQYRSIKLIAESYYEDAHPYNNKITELLTNLVQNVTWQEALARAIAEILEGNWLSEYKNILAKLQETNLWPTQWKGLAQGISILQNHSNVLIADPTGAGKTKLCTSLVLALQHWLYEKGENYRTNSLIICPPLVIEKWKDEFRSLKRVNDSQLSTGLLSKSTTVRKKRIVEDLKLAHILTVDEAHNYLSPDSNRTHLLKGNQADFKILVTATPISKKVDDLLRLIDLLDIDNLTDEDFEKYKVLVNKHYIKPDEEDIKNLRKFISKFTVRRTKKVLNKEIEKEPEKYLNKLNQTCKFPLQIEKTYKTTESKTDIEIVRKINELANSIKGITYLTAFYKPTFEISKQDSLKDYINKRINAGRALSIYMIRSALRSSNVALVEHIEGTDKALEFFNFKGKVNKTGNKIKKIEDLILKKRIPIKNKIFKNEYFPDWLIDEKKYLKVCQEELEIHQKISVLAKRLSGKRELGKVKKLTELLKNHNNILCFDSTVISLHYLKSLFNKHYSNHRVLVASGSDKDKGTKNVIDIFNLQSESVEKYVALCSDKMSESIDLQKASCVFLLDLPSVLRIVEQRIGRVDRMDSIHKEIEIYWPDDSEEFSLKADSRLVQTNDMVEQIYGANFNIPEKLREKHFQNVDTTSDIIKEFREFIDKDESWAGVHDSFQFIVELKEGKNPLISESLYEEFRNVSTSIKTRVSFLESKKNWCFIAFRGDKNKSPKWYFIDNDNVIHTDYNDICVQLRTHIKKKSSGLEWDDKSLKKYITLFKQKERDLLPPKKKRALEVAQFILEKKMKDKNLDSQLKLCINNVLNFLKPEPQIVIDYERLAEEWIKILQPYLNEKRENNRRKKNIYNLANLKNDHRNIIIEIDTLLNIVEKIPIVDDIDNKIASCIIGISNEI